MSGISDSEAITLEELVKGQKKIEAHESFIETLFRLGVVDEATKWKNWLQAVVVVVVIQLM